MEVTPPPFSELVTGLPFVLFFLFLSPFLVRPSPPGALSNRSSADPPHFQLARGQKQELPVFIMRRIITKESFGGRSNVYIQQYILTRRFSQEFAVLFLALALNLRCCSWLWRFSLFLKLPCCSEDSMQRKIAKSSCFTLSTMWKLCWHAHFLIVFGTGPQGRLAWHWPAWSPSFIFIGRTQSFPCPKP